ncbi:MAG: hypothetical protein NWP80_00010 [Candidatus Gracilibacteria bacterium]|nr:hypothetical protein [Candidatus Gracilibacteria bacterium]
MSKQILETKSTLIDGEKVFFAREIMKDCGYLKWERFQGAILKAISNLDENQNEISKIINTATGGRPREDYVLTKKGFYLILSKCDQRKKEVNDLQNILKKEFGNITIKQKITTKINDRFSTRFIKKRTFNFKNIFSFINLYNNYYLLILFIFILTGIIYFLNFFHINNLDYFNKSIINNNQVYENNNSEILIPELNKEIIYEEKKEIIYEEKIQTHNFLKDLNLYLKN